ncbi:hypothetical protein BUALT_Bualt10G0136700 [Buddleja alternifolia]|uniref:SPX domain-containing protein n=1 Tax=Buddleja alternifolia TaxID=168488 RepID=A0AAV6WZ69_9LAMI|nr:hypothetical protein BUALT_Bualt10G0136700 [Buddleja alternifolia]
MNFRKILEKLLDEIFPDWRDEFISYKDLKRLLKLLYPKMESSKDLVNDDNERPNKRHRLSDDQVDGGDAETEEMDDFVRLLEEEIKKFNRFFVDKEEDYIIRLKMLKDDVAEAENSTEKLMKVGRKMADFHGELILLENYSALNCIGLVKILKKYDKRSGYLLQLPFIQKVLHEPFASTELINKLAKECEIMIHSIFLWNNQLAPPEATEQKEGCSDQPVAQEETVKHLRVPEELAEIKCMENMYLRLTISVLQTLKQIRNGSSTINAFSFPPRQDSDLDEYSK